MGELFNPYPRLPKNIRQIGERETFLKLYVEDYVNTYLKRLYPSGKSSLRVGVLLGTSETYEGTSYVFIDGALEMEDVAASGEKVVFTETAWKKAYKSIEETFPKRTVQGWFICGAPGCILSPLNYWRQHNQYFGGKNQLMYLNSGIDGEEALYVSSEDGFYRLKGYHVYYERNQMMQDYMILRKDAHRVESGTGDKVIRDFRTRMEGRKQEAISRHSTIRTLGTLCSMLSVAVLAGGVVMFNNYHKMKAMESVLVSVLPEGVRIAGQLDMPMDGEDLIVEEIRGSVSPETLGADIYGSSESLSGAAENAQGEKTEEVLTGKPEGVQSEGGERTESENLTGIQAEKTEGEKVQGQEEKQSAGMQETGREASGEPDAGEASAVQKREPKTAAIADRTGEREPHVLPEPEAQNESGNGGNATAVRDYPVTNLNPGEAYLIGEGETLYGICFELYGSLKYLDDIRALNQLDDADRIVAGQELVLPDLS